MCQLSIVTAIMASLEQRKNSTRESSMSFNESEGPEPMHTDSCRTTIHKSKHNMTAHRQGLKYMLTSSHMISYLTLHNTVITNKVTVHRKFNFPHFPPSFCGGGPGGK